MSNTLALDVGDTRVGIALARGDIRIAIPHTTLQRKSEDFWDELRDIVAKNDVTELVVGLPRGLDGQETDQTRSAREFGDELATRLNLPITWQDEALTSVKAEGILRSQGKHYGKSEIDALAASLILTDYLETHKVSE